MCTFGNDWNWGVFICREISTFIQQRHINLHKIDSKDIYNIANILFKLNIILVNLKPKTKMVIVVLLNIFVETFSDIDNNKKCFLSSRSAYENDFWRIMSCDTEDWSNDAENSALHYKKKLHYKMY